MAPSAQLQRAQAAIKAMKLIGFDQTKAKKVLKKLLKVYENNWEYIEAENYRLLADSILDDQESMDYPEANEIDATASGSPELSNKRLRCKQGDSGHLPSPIEAVISGETSLKKPKLICSSDGHLSNSRGKMIKQVPAQISHEGEGTSLLPHSSIKNGSNDERMSQHSHNSINVPCLEKSKPVSLLMHDKDKHQLTSMSGNLECYKNPKIEHDAEMLGHTLAVGFSSISDMPDEMACNSYNYDVPIALLPSNVIPFGTKDNHGEAWKGDFLCDKASNGLTGANRQDAPMNEREVECFKVSTPETSMPKLSNVFMNTDVASSNMGEVFFSADVKGWGLRTLEELPRGAFICEYVGEILTNIELYDRTIQKTGAAKHTYPVLLDADWGSEAGLRDEEALCLDATFYGNVGRFVNHRCFDANLVEVPVEWETPDHHYYHLAFFTTRKVEPLEELTWDYGIDFDDRSHPIKAFKCLCGSRFCRDKGRTKTRSRASGLR